MDYCVQGFRKIDTDKWEFANEAFQRGKRHLLKNIQRRKSPQSQQIGSYVGPFDDIEKLRKERSVLMQQVVELQQQQRGTTSQMEAVNKRIKAAEQRQKQMISFLAKLFQNPAFIARLREQKEQGDIKASNTRRKLVRHQPYEPGKADLAVEGQIVKYKRDWSNLTIPSVEQQSPGDLFEGLASLNPTPVMPQEYMDVSKQVGEEASSHGKSENDPYLKGKNVVIDPQLEVSPGYLVSFPEDLVMEEKNVAGFSSPGMENFVKQEDLWSMGFDTGGVVSGTGNELWGNLADTDVADLGISGGFSDIWDLSSLNAGGSGVDLWPAGETPSDEPESQAGQPQNK